MASVGFAPITKAVFVLSHTLRPETHLFGSASRMHHAKRTNSFVGGIVTFDSVPPVAPLGNVREACVVKLISILGGAVTVLADQKVKPEILSASSYVCATTCS